MLVWGFYYIYDKDTYTAPPGKMAPRPTLRPLVTPKTMLFPSELYDRPMAPAQLSPIKTEDGDRTAITPPPAYTEFLNAMTPVFASPAGSEFPKSPFEKSSSLSLRSSTTLPSPSSPPSSTTPPTAAKACFSTGRRGHRSKARPAHLVPPPPPSAPIQPTSPSRVPYSARRLPYPTPTPSSASASPSTTFFTSYEYRRSPTTEYHYAAHSPRSAYSYSSAARSPYSASDWKIRALESPRSAGGPGSAKPPPLSVRHVVTRRVTYRPGPAPALHPPPRGKRRKGGK